VLVRRLEEYRRTARPAAAARYARVAISVTSEEEWLGLRRAMGDPAGALLGEARFADAFRRKRHEDAAA
jgi:hypothetical protein